MGTLDLLGYSRTHGHIQILVWWLKYKRKTSTNPDAKKYNNNGGLLRDDPTVPTIEESKVLLAPFV